MSKIVFAACMSVEASDKQPVWKEALAHQPDWVILCGDNIYMDYFPNLKQSKKWSPAKFFNEMQERYARQFLVSSFRKLIESVPSGQVLGVWDDHDFAWNNCFGTDIDADMPIKRRFATALFHHYFAALNIRPLPKALPVLAVADISSTLGEDDPAYRATNIGAIRVLLCDGRSFREDFDLKGAKASLLGDTQEQWLLAEIAAGSGPFLIVSGSTMTDGDDQSWDVHQDFFKNKFLPAVRDKVVLFMAGDVHENRLPPRVAGHPIEMVSSAAVLDFPFNKRNFGLLELLQAEAKIFLFKRGRIEHSGKVNLTTGALITSMSKLLDDTPKKRTRQQAQRQRQYALQRLDI